MPTEIASHGPDNVTLLRRECSVFERLHHGAIARERAEITKQPVENLLSIGDTEAALEQEISYFTHLARAVLIEHAVYPASRPELPNQLREIGETELADEFSRALESYPHTITS